jgi:hypothetical protein
MHSVGDLTMIDRIAARMCKNEKGVVIRARKLDLLKCVGTLCTVI